MLANAPPDFDPRTDPSTKGQWIKIIFYPHQSVSRLVYLKSLPLIIKPQMGPSYPAIIYWKLPHDNLFALRKIDVLRPYVSEFGQYEWYTPLMEKLGWWQEFDDLGDEVIDDRNVLLIRDSTPSELHDCGDDIHLGFKTVVEEVWASLVY